MMTATLSQTTSNTVTAANSASCSANNLHADNRYIRIFDLPAMGINTAFSVTQVSFGIETALGNAGTQPATVLLHTITGGNSISNLVQLAATSVTITDQEDTLMNVAINATVPAGSKLAVELFTPNGQTTNNSFFIGSNALGETTPGFVVAADCMLNDMTTPASFGFPTMHMVLEATGTYSQ